MSPVLVVYLTLLGVATGSFLNVVIHRVPEGLSIMKPRSRCPGCETMITAVQNIPVVSYVLLRGRCAHCGISISFRYPAIELLTGGLFLLAALQVKPTAALPAVLWLTGCLVAASAIDLERFILPNRITLAATIGAVVLLAGASLFTEAWGSFLGALIVASASFVAFAILHLAVPRGFGAGDVKLIFPIALVVGWISRPAVLVGIMLAFTLAATIGITLLTASKSFRSKERHALPFGPFLAVGGFVSALYGTELWNTYTQLTGL